MKVCNICKEELDLSKFYKMKNRKDGLMSRCKKCHNKSDAKFRKLHPERAKEIAKKCVNKRNSEGKCRECNNLKMNNHNSLCEKHWYRQRASLHLKDGSKWPLLKELVEKQNFKCVYTNEELIPGLNMSLDHIKPFAKGGEHIISNLQWISLNINYMKRDMDHNEFIETCKVISNNFNN